MKINGSYNAFEDNTSVGLYDEGAPEGSE